MNGLWSQESHIGSMLLAALLLLSTSALRAGAGETDIRRDATVNAIEKVLPSVVNIATETVIEYHEPYDEMLRRFYGWLRAPVRQERSVSLGSGVIIDEDGYILTNLHVVRRANRIQVKLWDGREFDAQMVASTTSSDIAVLRLKAKTGEKFKAIKLAADDDLLLGETVLALGNPFGLGGSVTKGILSSKNRRPPKENEPLDVQDWLQTDAAINPGNSGGPLVNLRGELIGLNVAVYREEDGERGMGVGFSIPVKQVSAALAHFFIPEVTDGLWLGAQFKAGAGLPTVAAVQAGSPAAKAGLSAGDRLLQINGAAPKNLIECSRLLAEAEEHKPRLLVEHRGERRSLTVTMQPLTEMVRYKLGLSLAEMSQQAAQRLGVRPGEALLIQEVEPKSPAEAAELERGYLLAGIDGQNAPTLKAVAEALLGKKKGDNTQLSVIVPRRLGAGFLEFRQGTVEVEVR